MLGLGKTRSDGTLQVLGERSEGFRTLFQRSNDGIEKLLSRGDQVLHVGRHIFPFGFVWVHFVSIGCGLNFVHQRFEDRVKVGPTRQSSEGTHEFGGDAIASKQGGGTAGRLDLSVDANSDDRHGFVVSVQNTNQRLQNSVAFFACSRTYRLHQNQIR